MEKCEISAVVGKNGNNLMASIWTPGGGMSVRLDLTEGEARSLARDLIEAADSLPRVGTAADLGCEVL